MSKNKTLPKLIRIILIGIAVLISVIIVLALVIDTGDGTTDGGGNSGITNWEEDNTPVTEYLGFNQTDVFIEDNYDFTDAIYRIYDNVEYMLQLETQLEDAALAEDSDTFFNIYKEYNTVASEVIYTAEGIDGYLSNVEGSTAVGSTNFFVQQAYAKERSSWAYYIPVFGSLLKAKHQSIENARIGVYKAMKEMTPNEQQEYLTEFDLDSIEDIMDASDRSIESMARDTYLKSDIDWTKTVTDLGKQAVIATVEGCKK